MHPYKLVHLLGQSCPADLHSVGLSAPYLITITSSHQIVACHCIQAVDGAALLQGLSVSLQQKVHISTVLPTGSI
jgi:hypothetical protein